MPIMRCTKNGKTGYKWGPNGTCHVGPEGRAQAQRQETAILARMSPRERKQHTDRAESR